MEDEKSKNVTNEIKTIVNTLEPHVLVIEKDKKNIPTVMIIPMTMEILVKKIL